jgi:hypothetical protein
MLAVHSGKCAAAELQLMSKITAVNAELEAAHQTRKDAAM